MSDFYLGQIMMTGFGYAQRGFLRCDGALLAINQNAALFSLLGVQYGGNGSTTFQLPDLRGRTPAGSGASVDPTWQPAPYVQGMPAGVESVTLDQSTLPVHTHTAAATTSAAAGATPPEGGLLAASSPPGTAFYAQSGGAAVPLASETIGYAGGSMPHPNMQPYTTINFNIAMVGIFPSRS